MKPELFLLTFIGLLGCYCLVNLLWFKFRVSQYRPVFQDSPKQDDLFVARVKSFYFSHEKVRYQEYFKTENEALLNAKKNAVLIDKYGKVHKDMGISFSVEKVR